MKTQEGELLSRIRSSEVVNSLVKLLELYIEVDRDILENATPSEINFTQGSIRAYRKLLKRITEPVTGR